MVLRKSLGIFVNPSRKTCFSVLTLFVARCSAEGYRCCSVSAVVVSSMSCSDGPLILALGIWLEPSFPLGGCDKVV